MDFYLYFIFLVFFTLWGRKIYQKKFVLNYLKQTLPQFSSTKIELPPKEEGVSAPEFLNYWAGKILAEKIKDARLWDYEEKKETIILKYFSKSYLAFFSLKVNYSGNFSQKQIIKINIEGEKIIPATDIEKLLQENLDDYFIPYKLLKITGKEIESKFKIFKTSFF